MSEGIVIGMDVLTMTARVRLDEETIKSIKAERIYKMGEVIKLSEEIPWYLKKQVIKKDIWGNPIPIHGEIIA